MVDLQSGPLNFHGQGTTVTGTGQNGHGFAPDHQEPELHRRFCDALLHGARSSIGEVLFPQGMVAVPWVLRVGRR